MAALVVDASIVLAVLLPDESDSRADVAIDMLSSNGAVAPSSWPLEVANGLLRAHRRRRINAALLRKGLDEVALLPVALDAENNRLAWTTIADLAARYNLATYDAAYLELALRMQLPLATLDNDLFFAARKARAAVVD
jgi:predicted nucleic acid-binding protein